MTASLEKSPYGHPQGKMAADGTWERNLPARFALKLPVAFGTADAAALYTVPADKRMHIERTFWEVTTAFTGGSSSAIGVSSDQAPHETKGDLLGGASGDVLAGLTAGVKSGTIGASFGSNGVVVLEPGSVIRFDRITSAFTAGAGFVHLIGTVVD
jgi:hypothetical protein